MPITTIFIVVLNCTCQLLLKLDLVPSENDFNTLNRNIAFSMYHQTCARRYQTQKWYAKTISVIGYSEEEKIWWHKKLWIEVIWHLRILNEIQYQSYQTFHTLPLFWTFKHMCLFEPTDLNSTTLLNATVYIYINNF